MMLLFSWRACGGVAGGFLPRAGWWDFAGLSDSFFCPTFKRGGGDTFANYEAAANEAAIVEAGNLPA